MTTATAPDLDKLNATIDGVVGAMDKAGDVVNKFSPILKASPFTAMFSYAAEGLDKAANLTVPPIRLAFENAGNELYGIALRNHISKMEPNAVLDYAAEQSPELKEIAEIGKTDPAFAQAFKDMLVKDKNALRDIQDTLKEDGAQTTLEGLKIMVKNDETRSQLTLKMQQAADSENYGFADMKNELLGNAGANSMAEFFRDIFANPNMFLSKMEALLGPDNMLVDILKPVLAAFHGIGSVMREGLGEYAKMGPELVKGSEEYLRNQGETWSTFKPIM